MKATCVLASAIHTLGHSSWHLHGDRSRMSNGTCGSRDLLAIAAATGELSGAWRIETQSNKAGDISCVTLRAPNGGSLPSFEITRHDGVVMVYVSRTIGRAASQHLVFGAFQSVAGAMQAIQHEVFDSMACAGTTARDEPSRLPA